MTPFRTTLALLLIAMAVIILVTDSGLAQATGVSISPTANGTTAVVTKTHSLDEDGKAKLAAIAPVQEYKANMAPWQRKLSSDLWYVIDPDYPPGGNTREKIKAEWACLGGLIPENDTSRLIINNPESPAGDYIPVLIVMKSGYSRSAVEPFIARLKQGDNEWCHDCDWINLNEIEQLASLDAVARIDRMDIRFGGSQGSFTCWNGSMVYVPFMGNPGTDLQVFKSHIAEKAALGVNTTLADLHCREAQQLYDLSLTIPLNEPQSCSAAVANISRNIYQGETALDKAWAEKVVDDASNFTRETLIIHRRFNLIPGQYEDPCIAGITHKQELAMFNISSAYDELSEGNYERARSHAEAASQASNESRSEALALLKEIESYPLYPLPLTATGICVALAGAGLLGIIIARKIIR